MIRAKAQDETIRSTIELSSVIGGLRERLFSKDFDHRSGRSNLLVGTDIGSCMQKYLGDKGLGTHLLMENNPKKVDPLARVKNATQIFIKTKIMIDNI